MALARKIRVTVSEASINKEAASVPGRTTRALYSRATYLPPTFPPIRPTLPRKGVALLRKSFFRRVQLPPLIKGCRVLMTLNDTRGGGKKKGKGKNKKTACLPVDVAEY